MPHVRKAIELAALQAKRLGLPACNIHTASSVSNNLHAPIFVDMDGWGPYRLAVHGSQGGINKSTNNFGINQFSPTHSASSLSSSLPPTAHRVALADYMATLGKSAKEASVMVAKATTEQKNTALEEIALSIEKNAEVILQANQKDIEAAHAKGMDPASIDRLKLTNKTIQDMVDGVRQVITLNDPVGAMSDINKRESGIAITKMSRPLGVIGIIYESRPNVTVDSAALCIKSGNAAILRGGSEAFHTNQILASLVREGLERANLPAAAVQVVNTADREAVGFLIKMQGVVDVIVPRGGKELIKRLREEARVPMIEHLDGICHTYIDKDADPIKAIDVAFNAKCQRYSTCNTTETLLVHRDIIDQVLPQLAQRFAEKGVELFADERAHNFLAQQNYPYLQQATQQTWSTEHLAAKLGIKIVDSLDEAINHINTYSSKHTEAILTENPARAMRFLHEIDSASVMHNASTRFADGFEYGLGAEIGIATGKLHASGPVGLEGLVGYKYIVLGNGQQRGLPVEQNRQFGQSPLVTRIFAPRTPTDPAAVRFPQSISLRQNPQSQAR